MSITEYFILPDGRMKPKDTALYTGFSERTLANWRVLGQGPVFIKRNGRIFYMKTDLDDWLIASGFCYSTAQAKAQSLKEGRHDKEV